MTRERWLLVVVAGGVAIFALSFVNAWIGHERELRGEGYRFVEVGLSAWRGVGMPVLTIGAAVALATAGWAALALRRPSLPVLPLLAGAVVAVAIIGAAAWPISQVGHASTVELRPAPLLWVGVGLAVAMVVAAVVLVRPAPRVVAVAAVLAVVAFGGGAAGRWLGLQLAEGTGRHWSDGSYTRPATDAERQATLTIDGDRYAIDDRWAGTWEWSGWTVVMDGDPACPDSRGTYHAHGEEDEALRFVKVVDTCQDGARAAALETGIWARDP